MVYPRGTPSLLFLLHMLAPDVFWDRAKSQPYIKVLCPIGLLRVKPL